MPSLSQILGDSPPLLLLDASSERIQAGLLAADSARWATRKAEAGTGIFECLDELSVDISSIGAFAYCEGPGSILGIRTTAVALRMWNVLKKRPTFSFQSLAVAAHGVGRVDASLIADARRSLWHRFRMGGVLERVAGTELSGEILSPEGFRHWEAMPAGTTLVSYDLASLLTLPAVADADLFNEDPEPDAFLHEEPSYVKWTPQIHRAP
ncbi:MAG TPA: peptidase M22 [Opitutaceae bacterium]|jgi:tRNA threonylcarbamoyladenosine biosynthesis protein TsaB|nr:peptidase M22 [Opitutaceae bacterium]